MEQEFPGATILLGHLQPVKRPHVSFEVMKQQIMSSAGNMGEKSPVMIASVRGKGIQTEGLTLHSWSQPELAAKCQLAGWDVSRDIIARIECRTRWVGDFELAILADVLKVEITELLPQRRNVKKGSRNVPSGANIVSFLPQEIVSLRAAETPPSANSRKRKPGKK